MFGGGTIDATKAYLLNDGSVESAPAYGNQVAGDAVNTAGNTGTLFGDGDLYTAQVGSRPSAWEDAINVRWLNFASSAGQYTTLRTPIRPILSTAADGFIVVGINVTDITAARVIWSADDGTNHITLSVQADGSLQLTSSLSGSVSSAASTIVTGTNYIITAGFDGAEAVLRIDEAPLTSGAAMSEWFNDLTTMDQLAVGARRSTGSTIDPFDGQMTRPVVGESWDLATIQAIEAELAGYLAGL
jgi:hypothetical protein